MRRSRVGLTGGPGSQQLGSGLFLPVVLLYVTRVVGLPLAAAGTVVALGTVAGLAVPPTAGRLVDRVGPRRVVIGAELLQALGAVTYLAAWGTAMVAVATRGRYLAAFQYSFTVPGVVAPAVVALFSVAVWLPWVLVGAASRAGRPGLARARGPVARRRAPAGIGRAG